MGTVRGRWILLVWLSAASACARPTRPASPRDRTAAPALALMPTVWLTEPPSRPPRAEQAVVRGLAESGARLELRRGTSVEAAIARSGARQDDCVDDLPCLQRVGRALSADKALVVRLGALGDMVVVRLALVDVAGGTREQARQQVVRSSAATRVEAAVRRLAKEIGAPFAPRPVARRAWYQHWAFWAGVGTTVVVAAGTTAWIATRPEGRGPEEVIDPP